MVPSNSWVVLFAGGQGSRLSSSENLPKPLVNIHKDPLIWELILLYKKHGLRNFLICLGFGAESIQKFFISKLGPSCVITPEPEVGSIKIFDAALQETYILQDTGLETQTAGRLKQVFHKISGEQIFLNYSDALSDVDLKKMYNFHTEQNKDGLTLLSVKPTIQFGVLDVDENNKTVKSFIEKPTADFWINAGFFIINKQTLLPFISACNNTQSFEEEILTKTASQNLVKAFFYDGFWMCVDTQKDLLNLRKLWKS